MNKQTRIEETIGRSFHPPDVAGPWEARRSEFSWLLVAAVSKTCSPRPSITIAEDLMLDGPLSISAWVKPLGPKGYLGIVTKGEGWGEYNLHLKSGSRRATLELKPFLPDAATAPVGRTELGTGVWHHVAGTWDGTHARVFVNGQEDACTKGRGSTDSRSALLRFGQIETRHAPCALDEVRISATLRPADWFRASWKNQSAPARFYEISVK